MLLKSSRERVQNRMIFEERPESSRSREAAGEGMRRGDGVLAPALAGADGVDLFLTPCSEKSGW